MCHGPGVQVVALVPAAGPVPPPSSDGDARHQRLVDLLRADEMDMGVEAAGGEDLALAGDDLGAGADDDGDAGLDVGIAGLADGGDAAVLEADIGLDDAPVVEDQRIGDDGVDRALLVGDLALAHAVADHLAAAEFHLLAVDGEILLDLDDQVGVGEPHAVAGGGPEHVGIDAARDFTGIGRSSELAHHVAAEAVDRALARRARTSVTSRVCPGSKRTAVPAAMSSRMPRAFLRSNLSAGLVSKKW